MSKYNVGDIRGEDIEALAAETGVPAAVIAATVYAESGGKNKLRGGAMIGDSNLEDKAYGPMQMRRPAREHIERRFGEKYTDEDMLDQRKGLRAGTLYLKALLEENNGDILKAMTRYNGSGSVAEERGRNRFAHAARLDPTLSNLVKSNSTSSDKAYRKNESSSNSAIVNFISSIFGNEAMAGDSVTPEKIAEVIAKSADTVKPEQGNTSQTKAKQEYNINADHRPVEVKLADENVPEDLKKLVPGYVNPKDQGALYRHTPNPLRSLVGGVNDIARAATGGLVGFDDESVKAFKTGNYTNPSLVVDTAGLIPALKSVQAIGTTAKTAWKANKGDKFSESWEAFKKAITGSTDDAVNKTVAAQQKIIDSGNPAFAAVKKTQDDIRSTAADALDSTKVTNAENLVYDAAVGNTKSFAARIFNAGDSTAAAAELQKFQKRVDNITDSKKKAKAQKRLDKAKVEYEELVKAKDLANQTVNPAVETARDAIASRISKQMVKEAKANGQTVNDTLKAKIDELAKTRANAEVIKTESLGKIATEQLPINKEGIVSKASKVAKANPLYAVGAGLTGIGAAGYVEDVFASDPEEDKLTAATKLKEPSSTAAVTGDGKTPVNSPNTAGSSGKSNTTANPSGESNPVSNIDISKLVNEKGEINMDAMRDLVASTSKPNNNEKLSQIDDFLYKAKAQDQVRKEEYEIANIVANLKRSSLNLPAGASFKYDDSLGSSGFFNDIAAVTPEDKAGTSLLAQQVENKLTTDKKYK